MTWLLVGKRDRGAAALADRHYSRRTVGSTQFMPPGQTVVFVTEARDAVFGWWRPDPTSGIVAMNKLDGWTCTIFRNESLAQSSGMVLLAEAAQRGLGVGCGPDGMMTYVWDSKVRSCNPGFCFKKAGWYRRGRSADKKKTLLVKPFAFAGQV